MDYKKVYNNLISAAKSKNRSKSKENYFELHHILPKCIGGLNNEDNLVLLTAKEHFVCHKLLVEIYPDKNGLLYALFLMCNCKNHKHFSRDYIVSSNEYERCRILVSKIKPKIRTGYKHSIETRRKIAIANSGKTIPQEQRDKISNSLKGRIMPERSAEYKSNMSKAQLGKKASEETKLKMSKTRTGVSMSEEHRLKMIQVRTGTHHSEETKIRQSIAALNRPIITCPYCGKSGSVSGMKGYHFDKCKHKPDNE